MTSLLRFDTVYVTASGRRTAPSLSLKQLSVRIEISSDHNTRCDAVGAVRIMLSERDVRPLRLAERLTIF